MLATADGVGRGHPGLLHPRRPPLGLGDLRRATSTPSTACRRGINAGGYVGDVALRALRRAATPRASRTSPPPTEQLAEMAGTGASRRCEAGALGYSISRSLFHRVPDGRNVPGTWSDPEEFFAIAEPARPRSAGACSSAPPATTGERARRPRVDEELAWMAEISRRAGPPVQLQPAADRARSATTTAGCSRWRRRPTATGAQLRPQITPRSVGVLFSLAANTLVDDLPSFQPLRDARPGRPARRAPRPRGAGPPGRRGRRQAGRARSSACSSCPPTSRPATTTTEADSIAGHRPPRPGPARSRPTSTRWTPPTAGPSSTGR